MKTLLKWVALFATVCSVRAQGTSEAMSSYTLPAASGVVFGTGGWAFQPSTNLTVTSLGCLQYLVQAQGDMQVGLWGNNGQLLASVSISATNPAVNSTYYGSIPQLFLTSGNTYRLGVYSPSGSVLLHLVTQGVDGAAGFSPWVQLVGSATGTGGFTYPNALGPNNTVLLGPNFQFITVVPEPSSFALLGLAGLSLVVWRRMRS